MVGVGEGRGRRVEGSSAKRQLVGVVLEEKLCNKQMDLTKVS